MSDMNVLLEKDASQTSARRASLVPLGKKAKPRDWKRQLRERPIMNDRFTATAGPIVFSTCLAQTDRKANSAQQGSSSIIMNQTQPEKIVSREACYRNEGSGGNFIYVLVGGGSRALTFPQNPRSRQQKSHIMRRKYETYSCIV